MPVTISVVERGGSLAKQFADAAKFGAYVKVGVQGSQASAQKRVAKGKKAGSANLADVASWHEFGTVGQGGHAPARSFIGATFDANLAQNRAFARELATKRLAGILTYDRSLQLMGVRVVGQIVKRIADGIAPPNADSTLARKKSSKPLIDTGQLRSGITFHVVKFGGAA